MSKSLSFIPLLDRPDLVSRSVANAVRKWPGAVPAADFWVAEIDPQFAGGADFCNTYGVEFSDGANCVIVEGQRANAAVVAAVVIPVGYRADFNGVVRKQLGMRRVSLANIDMVLEATGMEYGSITPVGLPASWPVLIHGSVVESARLVIGSGLLRSKMSLPGRALAELPDAVVISNLAHPA